MGIFLRNVENPWKSFFLDVIEKTFAAAKQVCLDDASCVSVHECSGGSNVPCNPREG